MDNLKSKTKRNGGYGMAQKTEKAISDALKKLLAKKPLNKITINDIAEECGINRMTFYYHYKDIYDLIESICNQKMETAIEGNQTLSTWQEGILNLMESIREDKVFFSGVYHSVEHQRITKYVYRIVSDLVAVGVVEAEQGNPLSEEDRSFIIHYYSYAFSGFLMEWVDAGMKEEPQELVNRLFLLGQGELSRAVEVFRESQPAQ